METLTVDLNREGVHEVDAPAEFVADGRFAVELVNHGQPVHVHLSADDALTRAVSLSDGNHYVEADERLRVPVAVSPREEPTVGRLEVASGYGSESAAVTVTIEPSGGRSVEVDESLSTPNASAGAEARSASRSADAADGLADRIDPGTAATIGFAAAAVGIAVAALLLVDGTAVTLGAGIVIGGAVVAAFLLLR